MHRNFLDAQAAPGSLDLHFYGPPIIAVLHVQLLESVPADGAKRSQVGVVETEQETDESDCQPIAPALLPRKRTCFWVTAQPGTQNEVGLPDKNWVKEGIDIGRYITAIRVHKDEDVSIRGHMSQASKAGLPISSSGLGDYLSPQTSSYDGGLVGAPVVYSDDLAEESLWEFGKHFRQSLFFVQGRE